MPKQECAQEVLIVSALGAVALLAHGINMFDYQPRR